MSYKTKNTSVPRSRKAQPDPYTAKIKKTTSKRELTDTLRHAVRNRDFDALEDYDEENLRPPTNAVKPEPDVIDQIAEEEFDSHFREWHDLMNDDDWDN